MGRIHPCSKSRGAVPERATRWRTTGCRTPGGGWDGGRVEARAEALPPGAAGLVWAGINFTWSDQGAPPRTTCGRDIFHVPHLVPPPQGSRPLPPRAAFLWGCGWHAGRSPEVAGGGGGLHPSKERKRGARGVLCCGIIVPWPPKVRCDPNPPVMGPECERIRKQRHRRLDESQWGHAGAGSLIQ